MSDRAEFAPLDSGVLDNLERSAVEDGHEERVTQVRPQTLLRLIREVRVGRESARPGMNLAIELLWLRGENARLVREVAEVKESEKGNAEDTINLASELYHLREGVRGFALTLRQWAVAAGGHTPSAIVASRLLQLIGDEHPPATEAEVSLAGHD